jgi:hypothetical protein
MNTSINVIGDKSSFCTCTVNKLCSFLSLHRCNKFSFFLPHFKRRKEKKKRFLKRTILFVSSEFRVSAYLCYSMKNAHGDTTNFFHVVKFNCSSCYWRIIKMWDTDKHTILYILGFYDTFSVLLLSFHWYLYFFSFLFKLWT